MRFLFDCTYVFNFPHTNTGIQRVVRNIIRQLPNLESEHACLPVVFRDDKVYTIKYLNILRHAKTLGAILSWRIRANNWYYLVYHHCMGALKISQAAPLRCFVKILFRIGALFFLLPWALVLGLFFPEKLYSKTLPIFRRLIHRIGALHAQLRTFMGLENYPRLCGQIVWLPFWILIKNLSLLSLFLKKTANLDPCFNRSYQIQLGMGDVLVLLDSSWHVDFLSELESLRKNGVQIVTVLYDLIPLTHPQYCDSNLVVVFEKWFARVAKNSNGFMAISQTISKQVQEYLSQMPGHSKYIWHGHFCLGNDLDLKSEDQIVRSDIERLFQNQATVYLMVSTIEPRKNHHYLLDAFEVLWGRNSAARLCIVGRIGWQCEGLIERICKHSELNRRLFMINDASDSELEYCYAHARALVFPSQVEGFGLPLVEAMQHKLPVMCSDIPVFREVCTDYAVYFDLEDPNTLANFVEEFDRSGKFPAPKSLTEWIWIDWRQSAIQLLTRIESKVNTPR